MRKGTPRSTVGSWGKPSSRLKDKARGHFGDRGVLTRTVRSQMDDNEVFSGESAVSNSAIAELGGKRLLDEVRKVMRLKHCCWSYNPEVTAQVDRLKAEGC